MDDAERIETERLRRAQPEIDRLTELEDDIQLQLGSGMATMAQTVTLLSERRKVILGRAALAGLFPQAAPREEG